MGSADLCNFRSSRYEILAANTWMSDWSCADYAEISIGGSIPSAELCGVTLAVPVPECGVQKAVAIPYLDESCVCAAGR